MNVCRVRGRLTRYISAGRLSEMDVLLVCVSVRQDVSALFHTPCFPHCFSPGLLHFRRGSFRKVQMKNLALKLLFLAALCAFPLCGSVLPPMIYSDVASNRWILSHGMHCTR